VGINDKDEREQISAETLAATFGVTKKKIKDFNQLGCVARAKRKDFKQIVCLAHSNDQEFGGLSANQFVKTLNNHIGKNLAYKDDVAELYLIGCEVGLIRADGSSLAQELTDRLYEAGYHNVKIHAVTAQNATGLTVKVSSLTPKPSFGGDKRPSVTLQGTTSTGHVCFEKGTMAPPRGANAIQQELQAEENTFWPQQVNHLIDERKTFACQVLVRQINYLNKKISRYQGTKLREPSIRECEDKIRILNALSTEIKSSEVTWDIAAQKIKTAADQLRFHGGFKTSTTRKVLLALAKQERAAIEKIFSSQDKNIKHGTEPSNSADSDSSRYSNETEIVDSESPGSEIIERNSSSRTPSPVRHRGSNNSSFFKSDVREPLLHKKRDTVAEIRYQINDYVATLRAEKRSKRFNPFVGWICNYKLGVFENLQRSMQNLITLEEIRGAVIATYLSNRRRIGSGLHNPSRAVSLITQILNGDPPHGTASQNLVLDDDALMEEYKHLSAPQM